MKKYLEKLRARPEHEKNHIVKIMALIATILIFVVYLVLIPLGSSDNTEPTNDTSVSNSINTLFNDSIENFAQVSEDIRTQREQISEASAQAQLEVDRIESLEQEGEPRSAEELPEEQI